MAKGAITMLTRSVASRFAKENIRDSRGVFETYTKENLRYSQTVPLRMYEEKNSGTNLPAQIEGDAHGREEGLVATRLGQGLVGEDPGEH